MKGTIACTLALVTAGLLPLLPTSAAQHNECSLDQVNWGTYAAQPEWDRRHKLEATVDLVDTHRLACSELQLRRAGLMIGYFYWESSCSFLEGASLEAGSSTGFTEQIEENFQISAVASEIHLYFEDSSCPEEGIVIIAYNRATMNVIIGVGNDGFVDRVVFTETAYKSGTFFGVGGDAFIVVPECSLITIVSAPVDPYWDATFTTPDAPTFGYPWAPNTLASGRCTAGEASLDVDIGAIVTSLLLVPGISDLPVAGTLVRWFVPLPTGGGAILPCVVLGVGAAAINPCAALGGYLVNTVGVLVDQDVPVPFGAPVAEVGLCSADVTATALGFGLVDVPFTTACYE